MCDNYCVAYKPKTAQNVEIYLGPKYRDSLNSFNDARKLISDAVAACFVPMGPRTECCGCDILYGQFFDGDSRAELLAQHINKNEGLCAKIVDVEPR